MATRKHAKEDKQQRVNRLSITTTMATLKGRISEILLKRGTAVRHHLRTTTTGQTPIKGKAGTTRGRKDDVKVSEDTDRAASITNPRNVEVISNENLSRSAPVREVDCVEHYVLNFPSNTTVICLCSVIEKASPN